jgi:hypothetical protein
MRADKVIHLKWEKSGEMLLKIISISGLFTFADPTCPFAADCNAQQCPDRPAQRCNIGSHRSIAALRKAARARSLWLAQCRLL